MNRFNKCNHFPFPCAFPAEQPGPTGAIGSTPNPLKKQGMFSGKMKTIQEFLPI